MLDDRVVVLGGGGFIGRPLVSQLAGKVRSIKVVSRTRSERCGSADVEYIRADVEDIASMMNILEAATVVFHLSKEDDFELAAHNVSQACLKHGVRRLIFASSSDALYLGSTRSLKPTLDTKPDQRNSYSRGKIKAEQIFLHYHSSALLPVVIVRPAIVVGRGGKLTHGGLGHWKTPTALSGWGDGTNPLPFVLVEDVAAAMLLAMDAPDVEGKSFDLAGDVFISARDWVSFLKQKTLRNFRFIPRNLLAMKARVAIKAIIKTALRRNSGSQYYRDMRSSAMFSQIDNAPAKRELNWHPNADLQFLLREAIDVHLPELDPNDLRLGHTCQFSRTPQNLVKPPNPLNPTNQTPFSVRDYPPNPL